jgi:hypothetical protein
MLFRSSACLDSISSIGGIDSGFFCAIARETRLPAYRKLKY